MSQLISYKSFKSRSGWLKFFYKSKIKICIILFLTSCLRPDDQNFFAGDEINKNFEKKFGSQIEEIKMGRAIEEVDQDSEVFNSKDPKNLFSPEGQFTNGDNISNSFDYVDKSYFGSPQPKQFFPSYETYQQGISNNPNQGLSPKIFEISYNVFLNPPFNILGEEFDYIDIPKVDAFGVKSSSYNKNYTLIPIRSLEKAIAQINKSKTPEDIEFSKKIIAERKAIIRNKKQNNFQEKNQFVRYYESSIIDNKKSSNDIAMKTNKITEKNSN
jgi:hypothetical protein